MQQHKQRGGFIIGLLSLGVLAGVALTASPSQAASGPGPYYAEPAWDRKMGAANRFLILTNWNNDAVLDRETGLVWEKSPATTFHTWGVARFQCAARTTGQRKGWRLPSVHELASLVDPFVTPSPTLPPGHPFLNVLGGTPQSNFYWSATTDVLNPTTSAWGVGFDDAIVGENPKADNVRIWCVRGGGPLSDY